MGGCEIDEESHRNCVCVQVKDIGRLTYRNVRWHMSSLCVAGTYDQSTRCIDVWGGEEGGGEVGRGLTIEVERLIYVLRRRDPAMS